MTRRFVFLDRDGTIIADKHYLADPDGVELMPQAGLGLRHFLRLGFGLIVVTNQSGVARGYFTQRDVEAVHARMVALLRAEQIDLAGIYICPHGPQDGCDCRKPSVGLALRAAAEHKFNTAHSVVIGDKASDMEFARRLQALSILLSDTTASIRSVDADYICRDLGEAANVIASVSS